MLIVLCTNLRSVICTHAHFTVSPSDNCAYLDARLTFRSAESTGLVEICNEQGQWSVACADNGIPPSAAKVICTQLGFDGNFANLSTVPLSSLNVGRPLTFSNLECSGNESTLTTCVSEVPVQPPTSGPGCSFQTRIQCGGE